MFKVDFLKDVDVDDNDGKSIEGTEWIFGGITVIVGDGQ